MSLHDDLANRLLRLQRSWRAMTGLSDDSTDVDHMAARWADALRATDERAARDASVQVLRHLVPEHEAAGSGFWATELGRAIARHGYAPVNAAGQVPAATVGAILGFSRARAHELQGRGRLTTPGLVAAALRERGAAA